MKTANDFLTEIDYLTEHNGIVKTLQYYIDGSRAGNSDLMRPGFHPDATLVGYVDGNLLFTPIKVLFDWIDENGPAPDIEPDFASIEILNTIAVVRLEIKQWSGNLAGSGVHMSDLFNLVKTEDGWKISQKLFHWHSQQM
ncbi:nuclear transport factor 2 family protein [Ilyomonas limi]|uniref:Nuclear transport factor 2 family protein n=1 Tax=Ilyomonas limi TaxID=2575867 RepID=A0A4U3L1W5_9BACT|nr:nuclear transport factor 2 family protein [Ilyomonas limi]TKK68998.1 nuclear transport factor 2 family protein [Ilyomonas limi]